MPVEADHLADHDLEQVVAASTWVFQGLSRRMEEAEERGDGTVLKGCLVTVEVSEAFQGTLPDGPVRVWVPWCNPDWSAGSQVVVFARPKPVGFHTLEAVPRHRGPPLLVDDVVALSAPFTIHGTGSHRLARAEGLDDLALQCRRGGAWEGATWPRCGDDEWASFMDEVRALTTEGRP